MIGADETIAALMDRIHRVPDQCRVFDEPSAEARLRHGVDDALLAGLLRAGLPHRPAPEGPYLDRNDLANVSIALRLPCPRTYMMRCWSPALRTAATALARAVELRLRGRCPDPGHVGGCSFTPHPAIAEHPAVRRLVETAPGDYLISLVLDGGAPMLDSALQPVLERVAELEYHYLPDSLARDESFTARSGLVDCRSGTAALVRHAAATGVECRPAAGLWLAGPYPIRHMWLEVRVDGAWWPADPIELRLLADMQVVDPETWPPYRSPGLLLWRLDSDTLPLVRHAGVSVSAQMRLRVVSEDGHRPVRMSCTRSAGTLPG